MGTTSEDRWRDLNVTKDEIDRIGEALKDEKFRKMFLEYAEEINDPKNREMYEREISQMEAEKGMDVQFIHPKPGHVIKVQSKLYNEKTENKTFVNICQNEHIGKPSNEKKLQENGKSGLQWSIPHSFSPVRDDLDKKGDKCVVYDVVFHPDTYKMAANKQFLNMIHDTALEGLERQFGLEINRKSMVQMKNLKYKGVPQPTVLRTRKVESQMQKDKENSPEDPLSKFPYPYAEGVTSQELAEKKAQQIMEEKEQQKNKQVKKGAMQKEELLNGGVITPEYTVTYQYGVDMCDFTQPHTNSQANTGAFPNALLVSIHLPKLTNASTCNLDVTERNVLLTSQEPVKYNLSVKLPYPIDEENGNAKFDKSKKRLNITLPVKKDLCKNEIENFLKSSSPDASGDDSSSKEVNGSEASTGSKLIEELPPSSGNSDKSSGDGPAAHRHAVTSGIVLDEKISYRRPQLTYEQDEDCVTLILDVCRVNTESFKTCVKESEMEVLFSTDSPSGFPNYYYIKLAFPDRISTINKSIGERNIVLSVAKLKQSLWSEFKSYENGVSEHETHEFITQSHIEKELAELEKLAAQENTSLCQGQPKILADEIVVREINSKHLSIDIQAAHANANLNLQSPEVIHKQTPPTNIIGILKRTKSESVGEDALCLDLSDGAKSDLPSSPTDTTELRERKKSVSFSEKVEETKFNSKDSVTQMHKILLNRKKKKRQRENREQKKAEEPASRQPKTGKSKGRRRRNSSTTESGSGDDASKSGNRRRSSSSASEDSVGSPRSSSAEEGLPNSLSDLSLHDNEAKESTTDTTENSNSDNENDSDDNGIEGGGDGASENKLYKSDMWSDSKHPVDKTKCAFTFNNSVIFDLDD